MSDQPHSLDRLAAVIRDRGRGADAERSYTAKLLAGGTAGIAKKLGEEAVEIVIASVEGDGGDVIRESADLLFHWLVLLQSMGLDQAQVYAELDRRHGISGLAEKASRARD